MRGGKGEEERRRRRRRRRRKEEDVFYGIPLAAAFAYEDDASESDHHALRNVGQPEGHAPQWSLDSDLWTFLALKGCYLLRSR